jgi:cell division septation protein DedD
MEKQKIFWVILAVTVFVVVVLVVGLFLLKQGPSALAIVPRAAAPSAAPATSPTGLYEFGRSAPSSGSDTEVLRFVIGGDGTAAAPAPGATTPVAPPAASAAPEGSSALPAPAKPAPSAGKPAAAPAKPAAPARAAPARAAKPAAAVRTTEYWIQTGSYTSQTRAEELSQTLTAKGLAGRVFSFSKADQVYFRVRIGPYTNKQEAEKFLAIIRTIQGLEASYISFVPGTRSVN